MQISFVMLIFLLSNFGKAKVSRGACPPLWRKASTEPYLLMRIFGTRLNDLSLRD